MFKPVLKKAKKKKREAFRVLKGGKKREQRESLKFVT